MFRPPLSPQRPAHWVLRYLGVICCCCLSACSEDTGGAATTAPDAAPIFDVSSGLDVAGANDTGGVAGDSGSAAQDATAALGDTPAEDAGTTSVTDTAQAGDAGAIADTSAPVDTTAVLDTTSAQDTVAATDMAATDMAATDMAATDVAATTDSGADQTSTGADAGPAPQASDDWFRVFGGKGKEIIKAVAADSNGNVYIAGTFNTPFTIGTESLAPAIPGAPHPDAFVASYDAKGGFRWAKAYGAKNAVVPFEVDVDGKDRIYVAGYHQSDLTIGGVVLKSKGSEDLFVVCLDAAGNQLWAKNWGGQYGEGPRDLSVNPGGDIFITGSYQGSMTADKITTKAATGFGGLSEIFVLAIDGVTHEAMWIQTFTGQGHDVGTALVSDKTRNAVIGISFQNNLEVDKANGLVFDSGGLNFDVGLARLDDKGKVLWANNYGGKGSEEIVGLDMDTAGNIYAAGVFSGAASFGGPPLQGGSVFDIMVAGYTGKGAHLWSVAYKGGSIDHVMDLQVAGDGVYVSGQFKQDLKIGSVNLKSMAAKYDVLVARFATKDGAPVWVKSVGSSGNDQGAGIGIGGGGGIYVGGHVEGAVTFGGINKPAPGGGTDPYVLRLKE